MLTLGIETSGRQGSIALQKNGEIVAEKTLNDLRSKHAQTLLLEIKTLLDAQSIEPQDCTRISVSQGPGSFTGLRVGVVCAKTFAFATGCELIAVDTLQAAAQNAPADVAQIFATENAQRGDLFVGEYKRNSNSIFERVGEITIQPAIEWLQALPAGSHVSGPGLATVDKDHQNDSVNYLDSQYWRPTASSVCQIGSRHTTSLTKDEILALEPFYLRKSAAEEKWDKQHSSS